MKKISLILVFLCITTMLFAKDPPAPPKPEAPPAPESPHFKSYNPANQFNIYASIGYWYGLSLSAGAELSIANFKIGTIPFDVGIAARGGFQTWSAWNGPHTAWHVAPLASLHTGLKNIPLEFFVSAGVGFGATTWYNGGHPGNVQVGFASYNGIVLQVDKNVGILLEYGYGGLNYSGSHWGLGVKFQL